MTTIVRFLRNHGIYFKGEVAGFDSGEAARLLTAQPPIAELHLPPDDDASAPIDTELAKLSAALADLRQREEDLQARAVALSQQHDELAARQGMLDQREADLTARETALAAATEAATVSGTGSDGTAGETSAATKPTKGAKAAGEPPVQGG